MSGFLIAPIVTTLNNYYGVGTYALVAYQATQQESASSGNRPNALLYNTTTVGRPGFPGPAYTTTVSTTDNADGITQTVIVRDQTPMANQTGRFIRLMVTH